MARPILRRKGSGNNSYINLHQVKIPKSKPSLLMYNRNDLKSSSGHYQRNDRHEIQDSEENVNNNIYNHH